MMQNGTHFAHQNGGCGAITIEAPFSVENVAIVGCDTPNSLTAGQEGTITVTVENTNNKPASGIIQISGGAGGRVGAGVWGQFGRTEIPVGQTSYDIAVTPPEQLAGQTVTPTASLQDVMEGQG